MAVDIETDRLFIANGDGRSIWAYAARVAIGWIEAWQVDPDQLEIALHHLIDMEERPPRGDGQMADFHFNAPVMAVSAAILALCDAFGVERFDSYDAMTSQLQSE